jgi:diaminopropionate ammonia-lyase
VSVVVNVGVRPARVPAPDRSAADFHRALPGYEPTPVRTLDAVADELGLGAVLVKDESSRLGLPAFKVLGASWATECALREKPTVHTLVAASAGNHGRAVARVAARRGLRCTVFLPARSVAARRKAIADEGAEVVIVDGTYEEAVARAAAEGTKPGVLEVADVGSSDTARWVIDGYATLFSEAAAQTTFDLVLVPVGVGSLAAAAVRHAVHADGCVVGVEPATAACLSASLQAGEPRVIATPGTSMAGLDCAEVSAAAWPTLRDGINGTVVVEDPEAHAAMRELAAAGLAIGESGAAPLAALRRLATDPEALALREAVALGAGSRVLLIATEGPTNPEAYAEIVG